MKKREQRNHSSKSERIDWTKTLGPVENLESYVKADWWRQIFNANYLRTDADVVEDPSITKSEVDLFLAALAPVPESPILDLCCGQGRHTIEFARRGFLNLTGLDRSHYLISRARAFSKRAGYSIHFKEGDARRLPFAPDSFDHVIIAGNSFGYFESLKDDLKVLKEVMRVLRPFGKLLIDVTDGAYLRDHYQPRSWEWIDRKYFVCRERSLSASKDRLVSREVISHAKKGVIADQFYAERLYTRDGICDLLKDADFADIKFHAELSTDSRRNQDLGMMERRLIVSCIIRKSWTPVRRTAKTAKAVAVLMGDPRRADIIKPNSNFDEDDFFTISELKKALADQKTYHFTYIDRHDTFIAELQKVKGKVEFVLNLCDEGFNNDPVKELHIPALLEILDIPYAGGTPRCLAYCYDKSLVRGIAKEMDIPVPSAFFVKAEDIGFIELPIDFPVIVKPNFGDSSFGITQRSVCHNVEDLESALLKVRETVGYDQPVLVEQFLTGKDISVGIIGNPPESYIALPIIEEDYSLLPPDLPRICGYEAKWDPTSPYAQVRSIRADLPEETERFLIASCIKLFERFECRDYARFDWRLDSNSTPRLLEANPNPGWCWDGHLAKMAGFGGLSYGSVLREIVEACEKRLQSKEATQWVVGSAVTSG